MLTFFCANHENKCKARGRRAKSSWGHTVSPSLVWLSLRFSLARFPVVFGHSLSSRHIPFSWKKELQTSLLS